MDAIKLIIGVGSLLATIVSIIIRNRNRRALQHDSADIRAKLDELTASIETNRKLLAQIIAMGRSERRDVEQARLALLEEIRIDELEIQLLKELSLIAPH